VIRLNYWLMTHQKGMEKWCQGRYGNVVILVLQPICLWLKCTPTKHSIYAMDSYISLCKVCYSMLHSQLCLQRSDLYQNMQILLFGHYMPPSVLYKRLYCWKILGHIHGTVRLWADDGYGEASSVGLVLWMNTKELYLKLWQRLQ